MSISEWVDQQIAVYPLQWIFLNNEKGWAIDIVSNMDDSALSERSQKRVHIIWFLLYKILKNKEMYNDSGYLGWER